LGPGRRSVMGVSRHQLRRLDALRQRLADHGFILQMVRTWVLVGCEMGLWVAWQKCFICWGKGSKQHSLPHLFHSTPSFLLCFAPLSCASPCLDTPTNNLPCIPPHRRCAV
jgi:hypothetical protein